MLSLRGVVRHIPKSSLRPSSSIIRSLSLASRPSIRLPARKPTECRIPSFSSFSTSIARSDDVPDSDQELSAKFDLERQLERQSKDSSQYPQDIQAYLDRTAFEIEDNPGTQEVTLTRQMGSETIKIEFSIADLNSLSEELDVDEDTALGDEVDDYEQAARSPPPKRNINQSRGGPIDVVPEDSVAPADRAAQGEEEEGALDEEMSPAYPVHIQATISKAGAGVVEVQATAQDGLISVDNVYYYPKDQLADPMTPEEVKESSSIYLGPPFSNLDQELQSMIERYVDERGINSDLATFLPSYVEFKEQREYVDWLGNMKKFIDA